MAEWVIAGNFFSYHEKYEADVFVEFILSSFSVWHKGVF